ncbi:dicarboxylate/amino acid:cation symporter [Corynebacterium sp. HMSC073D01]|uniref:dicarboxylate/amino acid:cation symporter n=1 Tax=Corynebacterium sp. HMSC073D01 TaxID=1739536 RepID=UPI0008A3D339|nr:dicarboxylate/amino acid:cation symporter [Corynebacterium sp. HMSC073D01]OFO42451.1 sodium:proton antiporter [Corynebacterium sp. HMSC073D01]
MTKTAPADSPTQHKSNPFTSFAAQVIYGLIIGLILGFISRSFDIEWLESTLTAVGSAYVTLLKVLIPPLVITAVLTSIANLRQVTNAARLAWQTLLWFAITSLASVVVATIVALVLKPGVNTTVDASSAAAPSGQGSWLGFLQSIVPSNILGLSARATDSGVSLNFNILQILVLSIAFGIASIQVGKKAEPIFELSASVLEVIQKVLWWVIRIAPIGTAALIGKAVATYGWDALTSLGMFVIAIYVGLALVMFVIYPLVLKTNGLSVAQFFRKVWPLTSLGFVTRSSMGVMPVTERTTVDALGVPRAYAAFAVPLGATSKMDGCAAVYPTISAIFVSQFYGIPLSITDYLLIAFVCVIGSAATAGTTGATVMLTLTLSTLGLPLEGVGLLIAVDSIIDMGRTATNVTGQALVPLIVSRREKVLDTAVYEDDDQRISANI